MMLAEFLVLVSSSGAKRRIDGLKQEESARSDPGVLSGSEQSLAVGTGPWARM